MRVLLTMAFCAAAFSAMAPEPAQAGLGEIERACRKSDRPAATAERCNCIQKVANVSLNRTERRKVARWFADPHMAQVVRQSDRRGDEDLWKRYTAFGERAAQVCQ